VSYATLMVYVEADGIPEQRVRIASELATKFDAALIGLSARAVPPPFVAEGVIIEKHTEADIEKMRMELAKRGDWFRRVVGADSKDVQWRTALDFPGGTLVRESRCADLVIIEQRNPGRYDTYRNLDPGEVLLKIGRPTLLVGPEVASLSAEHIVVAWKDSREAHRAVLDAMPFLRKAKRVSVVEVCTRDDERHALARTEDVVRHLSRHGIAANARAIHHRDRSDVDSLVHFVLNENADLLVAGAYGDSRFGEWVFGGMTRSLLATCPVCCLMSH
jgi:nucleotide-binding universal stress UspA family protein